MFDKKDENKLIVLLAFTYMISYITRINFGALIAEMVTDMGIAKSLLSVAVTGSFITYGAGQVISGIAGDKFSPKKLIMCGMTATGLINLLITLCKSHIPMIVLWSINGFAQAFIWPPIVKLMAMFLDENAYRRATVRVAWGSSVGTIAVYFIAPLLIAVSGWRIVFVFSAFCAALLLLIWSRYRIEDCSVKERKSTVKAGKMNIRILFTPVMICIMAAIMLQGMLRDGITTWMPSYIAETYDISNIISILTGVVLPIFAMISFELSAFVYRKKLKNPITCGGVFFGAGMASALVLLLSSGKCAAISVLCSALLTGCMHGVNMMLVSILPRYFDRYGNISTAAGILNACTYIGSAVSTYFIAFLAERIGWSFNLALWLGIAVLGTALCFAVAIPWKRKYMK